MSYVVLARKWRPAVFADVIGQEHVTRTLSNAIVQDRVHHAYLFCGARGVGKTTCARILAKALNCSQGEAPTPDPCGQCPSCKEIAAGSTTDVFEIDGASNRGIDEIRDLRDGVKYAPSRDRYKVYIIDEVHMLTEAAFNALLKTLEEPPPHVKFVFATTEPRKIPVTILSRCQRFDFKRVGTADTKAHLTKILDAEGVELTAGALSLLVREAEGSVRDSLSLLDQVIAFAGKEASEDDVVGILGLTDRRNLHELAAAILGRDPQTALQIVERVHAYGTDMSRLASEWMRHVRDLSVIRSVGTAQDLVDLPPAEVEAIRTQVADVDPAALRRLFALAHDAAQQAARSPQPKLILEMAVLRMADLAPVVDLEPLLERLHALEGRTGPPPQRTAAAPPSATPTPVATPAPPIKQESAPALVAEEPGPARLVEAAPAPVVEPAPTPVQEPVDLWRAVVDSMETERGMFTARRLKEGRPLPLHNGTLRVAFAADGDLEAAQKEVEALAKAATEAAGRPMEVEVCPLTEVADADQADASLSLEAQERAARAEAAERRRERAKNHPIIGALRAELDAEIVDVRLPEDI